MYNNFMLGFIVILHILSCNVNKVQFTMFKPKHHNYDKKFLVVLWI
jgi:hypothetical protein